MFAIIETGGKQYKVKTGDHLQIERLPAAGKSLKLDRVLVLSKEGSSPEIGRPFIKGAWCEAELIKEVKAPKVVSFKYIRREKSATKIGHRQRYLQVKIKGIHHGA